MQIVAFVGVFFKGDVSRIAIFRHITARSWVLIIILPEFNDSPMSHRTCSGFSFVLSSHIDIFDNFLVDDQINNASVIKQRPQLYRDFRIENRITSMDFWRSFCSQSQLRDGRSCVGINVLPGRDLQTARAAQKRSLPLILFFIHFVLVWRSL